MKIRVDNGAGDVHVIDLPESNLWLDVIGDDDVPRYAGSLLVEPMEGGAEVTLGTFENDGQTWEPQNPTIATTNNLRIGVAA